MNDKKAFRGETSEAEARASLRGRLAGTTLALTGAPVVCHGGTGREVVAFLHAAAKAYSDQLNMIARHKSGLVNCD